MLPHRAETTRGVDAFWEMLLGARGMRDAKSHRQVIMRDPCSYCGVNEPGTLRQCDHIVPREVAGGKTGNAISIAELDNLTAGCRSCNTAKGNTSLLLFLAERSEDRPTSAPTRQLSLSA
jgi:5-methylcytosine-specific restriction endonuclease McrA